MGRTRETVRVNHRTDTNSYRVLLGSGDTMEQKVLNIPEGKSGSDLVKAVVNAIGDGRYAGCFRMKNSPISPMKGIQKCGYTLGGYAAVAFGDDGRYVQTRVVKGKPASSSQVKEYAAMIQGLPAAVRDKDMALLLPADFVSYAAKAIETLAPKTVKNRLGAISQIFECAIIDGILKDNPVRQASGMLPTGGGMENRWGILTHKETIALLTDPKAYDDFFAYLVTLVAVLCGLREGEERAVVWGDIDIKARTLDIGHSANRDTHRGKTKTRTSRITGLPEPLPEVLSMLGNYHDDGDFVLTLNGKIPIGGTYILSHFKAAVEKACGLSAEEQEKRHIAFHSLRHGVFTFLAEKGVSDAKQSLILGHQTKTLSAMNMRYTHETDAIVQEVRNVMDGFLTEAEKRQVVDIAKRLYARGR